MLQAKMKNGELLVLAERTREEIRRLKARKEPFFCPVCKESVIMKAGPQVIPHFAHRSIKNCPMNEGGEGIYHNQGKLLLYRWLKSQGLDVTLEQYIPEIEQRPDLLIQINKKQIAVEYQCARISAKEIQSRNKGYERVNIFPLWIIGANRLHRQTKNHFRTDQMTIQLMYQFTKEHPKVLYYFCPNTLQFIRLYDLYSISGRQALAKMKVDRLPKLTLKALFQRKYFQPSELFELWKKEKHHFRLKRRKRAYGKELAWQQWLYAKGSSIDYLPSVIHLPIPSQYKMKTALWNWQSRLCLDLIAPLEIGNSFTLQTCTHLLRSHLHSSASFPFTEKNTNPIEEYLFILSELDYIKQSKRFEYVKIKPLESHKHIEVALQKDRELLDKLIQVQNKLRA